MILKDRKIYGVIIKILLVLSVFIIFYSLNEADNDIWGQLKCGSRIWELGAVPANYDYSYASSSLPWTNHEWLSSFTFYCFYHFFGSTGLVLLKIIIGFIVSFILWKTASRGLKQPLETMPVFFILCVYVVAFGFAVRCQIFTFLFFSLFLYLLALFKDGRENAVFFMPPVMILWANMHGGFVSGFGLIFIYLFCGLLAGVPFLREKLHLNFNPAGLKKLVLVFFLCAAAVFLNPYGGGMWVFVIKAITQPRPCIWEWQAPGFNWRYIDYGVLFIISLFFVVLRRRKIALEKIVLFLVVLFLSFRHVRHMPFFGITALFVAAGAIEDVILQRKKDYVIFLRNASILFLCFFLAFRVCNEFYIKKRPLFRLWVDSHYYPVAPVKFLNDNDFAGNVLTDFDWGEYCTFKFKPGFKIFIDGWYETVYPLRIMDEYFNFVYARVGWEAFLNKYPHDWILINASWPVAGFLSAHKDWVVVYWRRDYASALWVRKNSPGFRRLMDKIKAGSLVNPPIEASCQFP